MLNGAGPAEIDQSHVRALGRQSQGMTGALPAPGAGDEGDFALEPVGSGRRPGSGGRHTHPPAASAICPATLAPNLSSSFSAAR